jgi:hypothetical protein
MNVLKIFKTNKDNVRLKIIPGRLPGRDSFLHGRINP